MTRLLILALLVIVTGCATQGNALYRANKQQFDAKSQGR